MLPRLQEKPDCARPLDIMPGISLQTLCGGEANMASQLLRLEEQMRTLSSVQCRHLVDQMNDEPIRL